MHGAERVKRVVGVEMWCEGKRLSESRRCSAIELQDGRWSMKKRKKGRKGFVEQGAWSSVVV